MMARRRQLAQMEQADAQRAMSGHQWDKVGLGPGLRQPLFTQRPSARVLTPVSGHNPTPVYPRAARRHHIEGIVMIRVDVDDDGVAIRCAVLTTSGCTLLDDAALRAARQWRFDGGPGVIDLPFRFELVRRS